MSVGTRNGNTQELDIYENTVVLLEVGVTWNKDNFGAKQNTYVFVAGVGFVKE